MHFLLTIAFYVLFGTVTEGQMYPYYYTPYQRPNPYPDGFLTSYASAVPGSSMNSISGGPLGSNLPPPEPPQVLLTHMNGGQPPQPTQHTMPNSVHQPSSHGNNLGPVSHHGPQPTSAGSPLVGAGGAGPGSTMPLTRKMKKMVTTLATSLGFKSYYEAHGCVDPTTVLLGQPGRMASFAFMVGCNTRQADEACQMAQVAQSGRAGAQTRLLMEFLLPKETKQLFEQCLTPSTLMNGMTAMMGGLVRQQQLQRGPVPPHGAAPAVNVAGGPGPRDCGMVSQMLMMSPSATEGMMSPEAMEQIGIMRNRYFTMTCQENLLLNSLPFRMCCPGIVKAPSMQEAMMMRGMGGA